MPDIQTLTTPALTHAADTLDTRRAEIEAQLQSGQIDPAIAYEAPTIVAGLLAVSTFLRDTAAERPPEGEAQP